MPAPRPIVLLLLLCSGCNGGSRTAAQLVLTPDPQLGSRADLLARIAWLRVIIDGGEEGLRGVTAPGARSGGGSAADWDGDGQLEVLFELPRQPGAELPVLEVELDENAGRELDYRVLGFLEPMAGAPGEAAALGGIVASAAPGEVRQIGIPFNLRSWAQPPRVVLALPADNAQIRVPLVALSLLFSTVIKQESLAAIRMTDPEGRPMPLTFSVETLVHAETAGQKEERSLVQVQFQTPALPGTCTVTVGAGVQSAAGLGFDQEPASAAADPFTTRLYLELLSGGGRPCDACPAGYLCHDTLPGCIVELSCQGGCAPGSVCDTGRGWCVEDCRPFGVCASPEQACHQQSGLCVPRS